jgi:hypothetical protein
MLPPNHNRAPWSRARASMFLTAVWSLVALVGLALFSTGRSPWNHVFEFLSVAAMVTFVVSALAGIFTAIAGRMVMSAQRRQSLLAMLERPGRAQLSMKPSWQMLASAVFRFGFSAAFQVFAVHAVNACRGHAMNQVLAGLAMAAGLGLLVSGLRRAGEYAHMRDAWHEAQWLRYSRGPGVRQ